MLFAGRNEAAPEDLEGQKMNFTTFLAAVIAGVKDACKDPRFSPLNPFVISQHPNASDVHKVDGEAWTFYVVHHSHGYSILGWMEASQASISFN